MTSQVKGTINHNFPVEVILKNDDTTGTISYHRKSESSHGQMEVDLWFSGNQEVIIREIQPEVK